MRPNNRTILSSVVTVLALVLLLACAKKEPEWRPTETSTPPPQEDTGWKPEPPSEMDVDTLADKYNREGVLKMIHFETNKYDILPESRTILKQNAAWLLAHPEFKVVVEGHCDERNTEAYNLALGERRANAAREYLIGLGVPASIVQTVSYGKARPLCTESDESCWSQNRRAQFLLRSAK